MTVLARLWKTQENPAFSGAQKVPPCHSSRDCWSLAWVPLMRHMHLPLSKQAPGHGMWWDLHSAMPCRDSARPCCVCLLTLRQFFCSADNSESQLTQSVFPAGWNTLSSSLECFFGCEGISSCLTQCYYSPCNQLLYKASASWAISEINLLNAY